jgi:transcriptional regulator with XRE-family HTH domain
LLAYSQEKSYALNEFFQDDFSRTFPAMRREPIDQYFRTAVRKIIGNSKRGYQAEIARAAGISASQLNDILQGRSSGSEETRRSIAAALECSYEDLIRQGKEIECASEIREPQAPLVDQVTEKILLMLADLDEEKKREVLRYIEEKKLLTDLLKERKGGGEA